MNKMIQSPDSGQALDDLANFWRTMFMGIPCEDGLPEKLSKVDELLDFSDIVAMKEVKKQLEDAIDWILNPGNRELLIQKVGWQPLSRAVLLYGSPGNGKTYIAKAVAGELAQRCSFTIMHVPLHAIRRLHYTKKLTCIRQIFEFARDKAPCIVIWDEFDELVTPPRFSGRKFDADICAIWKQEFVETIQSDKIVLHFALSDHPWQIDSALFYSGRFRHQIHITPPDFLARKELFTIFTKNGVLSEDLDFDQLAEKTKGMTIAEIRRICEAIAEDTFYHGATIDKKPKFETADFVRQIEVNPPQQFQTWLAEAELALNGKYSCQKHMLPVLLNEIKLSHQQD